MFRDTKEELERLQEELLEEEEEETSEEEEFSEEDEMTRLLEEDDPIPDTPVYRNFSNNYGGNLRNFASGYRAYNGDKTDTDLEEYSRTVYEARKKPVGCCGWIIGALLLAAAAALVWHFCGGGAPL